MLHGFSGGEQVKKFASARNRGSFCLFCTSENEKLVKKTMMASYLGRTDHCYFSWMQ